MKENKKEYRIMKFFIKGLEPFEANVTIGDSSEFDFYVYETDERKLYYINKSELIMVIEDHREV